MADVKANKVKFGLKKAYYAPLTIADDGTATYGLPVAIPGAVSVSMDAEGKNENFYADDGVYYVIGNNNGYSGDIEVANLPDKFRQDCLGETTDTNGLAIENATAELKPFALLFEFSGDQHAVRHAIYNCTATRAGVSGNTIEDKKKVQTDKIKLTAAPLPATGVVKVRTTESTPSTVFDAWYTAVQVPAVKA